MNISSILLRRNDLAPKYGLIRLECEGIRNLGIFANINPCSISAGLSLVSIDQDPLVDALPTLLLVNPFDFDMALDLRLELVIQFHLALRSSSHHDRLL